MPEPRLIALFSGVSTIIVTGAAGFIGSHTCDELLAAGHAVVGVDNFRTGRIENLENARKHPAFRLIEADVAERESLDEIAGDVRPAALIHLAALVSVQESIRDPELNFRLNVLATHLVAEAARRHQIGRIVFASSAAVYGDGGPGAIEEDHALHPISPYGSAKVASEALLGGSAAAFGSIVRCQRYFNVYGPRQDPHSPYSGVISRFVAKLMAGEAPTIFGDGAQTRDFVHVGDVARANVLAATLPGIFSGSSNICTGVPTTINDLAKALGTLVPHAPLPTYAPSVRGDIRYSLGNPQAAARDLGFVHRLGLTEGLASLLED